MKLIISILLLTIATFAQNTTYLDGTECECDSIYSHYDEDGLAYERPLTNGLRNGIEKWYYKNGSLMSTSTYNNNVLNGSVNWYYESGELSRCTYFVNGKLNGVCEWYYKNGKLAGTANYKNGTLEGYKKCTDGRMGNKNLDCLN